MNNLRCRGTFRTLWKHPAAEKRRRAAGRTGRRLGFGKRKITWEKGSVASLPESGNIRAKMRFSWGDKAERVAACFPAA